jgi:hypothetical protein
MKFTTTAYIEQIAFDYFKTYSFQRKGDYAILADLKKKKVGR